LLSLDTIASGIRKWFFWSSLHFVAAAGLYAVIQYTTLLGVPQAWWGNSQEPKRAVAFFLHPNFYALFITPLLAFLLPTLGYKLQVIGESIKKSLHSPLSTLYPLVAWVLGAVGLLLSQSQKSDRYKPKVVMYEGDEATKMSYHYSFGSEFRIFKDLTGMSDIVPADYIEKDATKRRKDGVKMFMISPDTKENQDIVSEYKKHKSPDQFALIPPEKFSKSKSKNIGIGIYSDRVKFASGKDKFAIYIINQEITDTLRDLFDLAWEGSKNINRKKR
jgi:hypothetical protein